MITFLVLGCTSCQFAPEMEREYQKLFSDSKYRNGFNVTSTQEGIGETQGVLDYNATTATSPKWRIAQWNNINNDILTGSYINDLSLHKYETKGGNTVTTDTENGVITLKINTSSEYGLNGITHNQRKEGESWPHLLLEYMLADDEILKISDKKEIRMDIAYNILSLDDMMPSGTTNNSLHSAQFQWYITVQNRNEASADYGKYIWFGLSFYEKRYDFPPAYAAQDGGKEHNTGAFIYVPDMAEIMKNEGKTEIGKNMHVDVNILPLIESAFDLAQQRNYLQNTVWEDLFVTSSNIGWEMPGTYDATVRIDSINIKYY